MQTPPRRRSDRSLAMSDADEGERRLRIGLVLGAGGAAGLAFHAGVLWALHHDLGWDPRTADVIVGTSAGSIAGALLRSGVRAEDLAAWATGADPTSDGDGFRATVDAVAAAETRPTVPTPTMPGWHALNALRHPSQLPGALTTLLPHGVLDHTPQLQVLDRLITTWPTEPLWVSAVRVGDGRLVWFGRDAGLTGSASPADAVAASCAVPVLARPVRIDGHRYLDGGVKSPTHADVLVGEALDVVVVLSPMGQQRGRNLVRYAANRRVGAERRRLEETGVAVQLIAPDGDTVVAMGLNMMDQDRSASVMRHAFLAATGQLDARVRAVLAGAGDDGSAGADSRDAASGA